MEYEGNDFIHQTGFFRKIWILFFKYACYCDGYSCFIYLFILFLVCVLLFRLESKPTYLSVALSSDSVCTKPLGQLRFFGNSKPQVINLPSLCDSDASLGLDENEQQGHRKGMLPSFQLLVFSLGFCRTGCQVSLLPRGAFCMYPHRASHAGCKSFSRDC